LTTWPAQLLADRFGLAPGLAAVVAAHAFGGASSMRAIEIPTLRAGRVVAVAVELADVDGSPLAIVSVTQSVDEPTRRRWYADERDAIAYAAEQADRFGLPLLDLREPENML
jgi:post-segregation antitoxin (ccd killing protein)